jgi:hypothetical protein
MGLADSDRKELELLIKAAVHDPRVPVGLACRMVPTQGDVEDFAYGLVSGMMVRMPRLRMAIMKHLDMR